jgi:pyridoxine/pyridoxamine 5'-phosphate oxidase
MIDETRLRSAVTKALDKQSFMSLATASPAGHPHVAGVLFAAVDGSLYVNTNVKSRKARNIDANPNVAASIAVRRLPVGPPATIMFQGRAEIVDRDDPAVLALLRDGRLKAITSHGELDDPDNWFVKIVPAGRVHTFGIGVPLRTLVRRPLETFGAVDW